MTKWAPDSFPEAILLFHPDKQGDEADVEQLVRAERIFHALNEAHKISER